MQIHELNNFTGTLGSGVYLAVDDGNDTGKLSTQQLLAATEARIDNIIAGPAPSAEEIIDARLGDDGVTYPSLGDAIRDQVGDLKSALKRSANGLAVGTVNILFDYYAGYIGSDGAISAQSADKELYTNKIPVKEGDRIAVSLNYSTSHSMWAAFAKYDANENFLLRAPLTSGTKASYSDTITVDSTTKYIAFTFRSFDDADFVATTAWDFYKTTERVVDGVSPLVLDIPFTYNGYIDTDGSLASHSSYRATDFIEVTSDGAFVPIDYTLKVFKATKIGLYDSTKQSIGVISPSSSNSLEEVHDVLGYVDGLVYARFCTEKNYNAKLKYASVKNVIVDYASRSNAFCNYSGNEISMFRKGVCIGDSLTEGTLNYYQDGGTGHYTSVEGVNYPTYLSKLTGLDITNMGVSGYSSVNWWNQKHNVDLSGHDFAIIQLGVNDVGQYGGWNENTEAAFTNIINKLKTENKKIKIFVANIIPAISYSSQAYLDMSSAISSFVEGLSDPQVILLDMQTYGHTGDSEAYNCGHLSAYGYWRLAQDYKNYIGYYINSNKMQFREVQFIGTDYYYSN